MKGKFKIFPGFIFLYLLLTSFGYPKSRNAIVIDSKHYSNVFGEIRNYRVFFPPDYYDKPDKRYPVIYFYHGWSQRYFGSINAPAIDEGESNNGDNIANFVSTHDVIVVKPDGYNRKPGEEYYLRPYNISPVETYRQFPLYFPELVNFIDASYRTIPDRNHRAISGLSMGGFMTYWISGKYPHLVSAAGNFCGSAEFRVGPENAPVEYRHIDMAGNYKGLNVRLNFGNKDFIRCYHRDLNRIWPQVMDNYEFKIYEAEHTTCGLGEMFEFIMNTFRNPPEKPEKWDHIDVYPDFVVWDYQISSDRDQPGFTILENVDVSGFRSSVREFLPDGELMPSVNISVITSPIYGKNQSYIINDIDLQNSKCSTRSLSSDGSGRLKIDLDGGLHEIGINKVSDTPELCIGLSETENLPIVLSGKEISLNLQVINKGSGKAEDVTALLSPTGNNVKIINNSSSYGNISAGETQKASSPFTLITNNDTIGRIRFKLELRDKKNNKWTDYLELPVTGDVPDIGEPEIADGRLFNVSEAGTDTVPLFLGKGNGDGIPNPGESLVLLVKDRGLFRRTELISDDQYLNPNGVNIRMSDNWTNYDHVGGSAKYSVPLISSECPGDHQIEFIASYWLPAYPDHIIKKGKIKIRVTGKDNTPPVIRQAYVSGDNTVQVKVMDGSEIKHVKVRFIAANDPERIFEVVLNDAGSDGDRIIDDRLFSKKIPEQNFGQYRMEIEAIDSFGNTEAKKFESLQVIY